MHESGHVQFLTWIGPWWSDNLLLRLVVFRSADPFRFSPEEGEHAVVRAIRERLKCCPVEMW